MLHWTYIAIALVILVLVVWEMFREKNWRQQVALGIIVVPLVLRILHLK